LDVHVSVVLDDGSVSPPRGAHLRSRAAPQQLLVDFADGDVQRRVELPLAVARVHRCVWADGEFSVYSHPVEPAVWARVVLPDAEHGFSVTAASAARLEPEGALASWAFNCGTLALAQDALDVLRLELGCIMTDLWATYEARSMLVAGEEADVLYAVQMRPFNGPSHVAVKVVRAGRRGPDSSRAKTENSLRRTFAR